MKRTLFVIGTRPEAIKMCPIILELKKRGIRDALLLSTGQHKEMLDSALSDLSIKADHSLDIMKDGQTLGELTGRLLFEVGKALDSIRPETVVVHGDTTTAFASALSAFYRGISVAHVEAGLRTGNINEPFPEEYNRRAIALLASIHFAPNDIARRALLSEGVRKEDIFVTGNTVIDALEHTFDPSFVPPRELSGQYVIITVHRRENLKHLSEIFMGIKEGIESAGSMQAIYPMHKNPAVRAIAKTVFKRNCGVALCEPMSVKTFHNLLRKCSFVITDSGGVQEEAAYLGKPILLLRNCTERKELLSYSGIKIAGTEKNAIIRAIKDLALESQNNSCSPIGEAGASGLIASILENY